MPGFMSPGSSSQPDTRESESTAPSFLPWAPGPLPHSTSTLGLPLGSSLSVTLIYPDSPGPTLGSRGVGKGTTGSSLMGDNVTDNNRCQSGWKLSVTVMLGSLKNAMSTHLHLFQGQRPRAFQASTLTGSFASRHCHSGLESEVHQP